MVSYNLLYNPTNHVFFIAHVKQGKFQTFCIPRETPDWIGPYQWIPKQTAGAN